jgi:site-specific DNA recombinase
MAADERATMIERHRRGQRHAARVGSVNGRSGAPYGDRSVNTHAGGGHARDARSPEEARGVHQLFAWSGRARLSIGDVCRRLRPAGERPRPGRRVWARRVGWALVNKPASMGRAAVGKTRQGPLRPKLRAQRGRPRHPRRAASDDEVPPPAWLHIPVPASVEPAVCAAVQEQWQANRRPARQSWRGARYRRQGLRQCQPCGSAFYGKPLRPSARKGRPRAYADDRWVGTDAERLGGQRRWPKTQVRTDRLALAAWQEGCARWAPPARLAQECTRRLHAAGQGQRQARTA